MKIHSCIDPDLRKWIDNQKMFFVASAPLAQDGHVNVSPKGHDCIRVLDEKTVCYYDLTGSGNETSAHVEENGRITIMFCAYEGPPRILRLYGQGEVVFPSAGDKWERLKQYYSDSEIQMPGTRQIIVVHVSRVQTSCGYSVPFFDYKEDRETLVKWSKVKKEEGLKEYRREHNLKSIDGLDTPLSRQLTDQT